METEWAENRAKLPQDIIRKTLGLGDRFGVFDRREGQVPHPRRARHQGQRGLHQPPRHGRGLCHATKDTHRLAASAERSSARSRTAAAPDGSPRRQGRNRQDRGRHARPPARRARACCRTSRRRRCRSTTPSTAPGAASAWRSTAAASPSKTAIAAQGTYFVRYVDPAQAGKEEPGFFARMFGNKTKIAPPARYRVLVKGDGEASTVQVLDSQGAPENGDAGRRIVACWSTI